MTWTWAELIWSAANALGIIVNLSLIAAVRRKAAAVLARGGRDDGPRLMAANRYARNDLGRALCHAIGLVLGIWALLVPPGDGPLAAASTWGLVLIVLVLLALGVLDLLDERRLDRILAREQELGGPA